jgi:hypothetical protein
MTARHAERKSARSMRITLPLVISTAAAGTVLPCAAIPTHTTASASLTGRRSSCCNSTAHNIIAAAAGEIDTVDRFSITVYAVSAAISGYGNTEILQCKIVGADRADTDLMTYVGTAASFRRINIDNR